MGCETVRVYDPTQFKGAARYYRHGRPPYSAQLGEVLAGELGLEGSGQLLDVGSGPGTVGLQLAPFFAHVTLLEPDADMLAEARVWAAANRVAGVDFVRATAEDLPHLRLPQMRTVTFGQSFHRTDRVRVAEAVWDALEPGGAIVLIVHDPTRPAPQQLPDMPPIPHDDVDRLLSAYLGRQRRSGARPATAYQTERFLSRRLPARASAGRASSTHRDGPTSSVMSTASSPAICRCLSLRPTCSGPGWTSSSQSFGSCWSMRRRRVVCSGTGPVTQKSSSPSDGDVLHSPLRRSCPCRSTVSGRSMSRTGPNRP